MIKNYLKQLGLSEHEIRVYLACVELGESKIVPIAQKAVLPRTTVFQILERLKDKNLIQIIQTATRRIYLPQPPRNVLTLLKEKQEVVNQEVDSFEKALPELNRLYDLYPFQPKVRFFRNQEVRDIYLEILEEPIDEVWFVTDWDKLANALGKKFLENWAKKRVQKNIKSKVLFVGSKPKDKMFLPSAKFLRVGRTAPSDFESPSHIISYGDKIAVITTGEENFGVVTTSREYAMSMKNWFNQLWKVSR